MLLSLHAWLEPGIVLNVVKLPYEKSLTSSTNNTYIHTALARGLAFQLFY